MADFQRTFSVSDLPSNSSIVSIPLAASVFGSILSGPVADRIGRRNYFFVAAISKFTGSLVQIMATSIGTLILGRIISFYAIGIFSMLVPLCKSMYSCATNVIDQSEISQPEHRGRLIAFYQLGVTLGFCVAFWIGYGTSHISTNLSWRLPLGLQILPPFLLFAGLFALPESPRWLIYRERMAEAFTILTSIRSSVGEDSIQMEYIGIVQDVSFDKHFSSKSYSSLMHKGIENNRRRTLLGVGIHMLTQLTGINVLLYYLPHILQSTGITEINSELLGNGVSGMVNMLATVPVFFFIDKWDRRRILTGGSLAMAICMITTATVLGAYSDKNGTENVFINNKAATYSILTVLCLFIACFALSWGPLGWIYPAEIYPQLIRAKAMGVTTAASYSFNLFISQIAPVLFRHITWGTYVVFGCSCLLIAWVVHAFYPETRVSL
ncbi:general substrate transporter [Zychaea mexicana]|uniref:general substrate transporter n=1 Tax=Zychaea mexicana TaxID=64656 RepID=UPI0022FECFAC|nr:general substrate transporter [Zychaea mexicana]KAI9491127.1 general substrate transporter [Zychaea mexicana]